MTYALAWPLQQAVHARLTADPGVTALLGDRIHDAAPDTPRLDQVYAVLGDEEVDDWSTATDRGAEHLIRIAVHAPRSGFAAAKQAAAAISDALIGTPLTLARGHVVCIGFVRAETARSEDDALRSIALGFRVLIEDTA